MDPVGGRRNIVAHDYANVDLNIVWQIATVNVFEVWARSEILRHARATSATRCLNRRSALSPQNFSYRGVSPNSNVNHSVAMTYRIYDAGLHQLGVFVEDGSLICDGMRVSARQL